MKIAGYETHPAADTFDLLDGADFKSLCDSIRTHGLKHPIELDAQKRIIDGRNRLRACVEVGAKPRFVVCDPPNVWAHVWTINRDRRHLEAGRIAMLYVLHEERRVEEERAARAMAAATARRANAKPGPGRGQQKVGGNVAADLSSRADKGAAESRTALAQAAGVSPRTMQKALTLHERAKGDEKAAELEAAVAKGRTSLNAAARDVSRREAAQKIEAEPAPLPIGPFRVIVADPPWQYTKRKDDGSHRAALTYPDMTTPEICALPVGQMAHEDSILWLWTTNAFMRDAYAVLDAWGFVEKTILTWAKNKMGTGDWLRGKTEHCILAVRGKPVVTLTNQTTLLEAAVREHSRKPDEFYALVEALCPGSKVELFCREQRPGWSMWGAETEKFVAAE